VPARLGQAAEIEPSLRHLRVERRRAGEGRGRLGDPALLAQHIAQIEMQGGVLRLAQDAALVKALGLRPSLGRLRPFGRLEQEVGADARRCRKIEAQLAVELGDAAGQPLAEPAGLVRSWARSEIGSMPSRSARRTSFKA
jgi:hypothetical protein